MLYRALVLLKLLKLLIVVGYYELKKALVLLKLLNLQLKLSIVVGSYVH